MENLYYLISRLIIKLQCCISTEHKYKQIDQRSRIESIEIDPQINAQLIFYKVTMAIQWANIFFSMNGAETVWQGKKETFDLDLHFIQKLTQNIYKSKSKTLNHQILRENIKLFVALN